MNTLPNACPVADTIYAVYPRNHHLPAKVRAVIEHLLGYSREILHGSEN
ncbi:hypothetical protein [Nitrosospira multiformis]